MAEHDLCPMGCGRTTDDVAGGPCSTCWDEVVDAPPAVTYTPEEHAEHFGYALPEAWRSPTKTQEGEYARNQQEAVEHIRTLPPSERSAVANRPGQAPPSTQHRETGA